MESASARIHGVHTSVKESHIRARKISRGKTMNGQRYIVGDRARVRVIIGHEIEITFGIGRTKESRIDIARTSKIGVPFRDIVQGREIKIVDPVRETRQGAPSIENDAIGRRMHFNRWRPGIGSGRQR
jgi:hypothetical protein